MCANASVFLCGVANRFGYSLPYFCALDANRQSMTFWHEMIPGLLVPLSDPFRHRLTNLLLIQSSAIISNLN